MSRSERLFSLLQALRRFRRPVSGKALAQELGVSMRTLYRDIATLQAQGADIAGEPGVGYVLRPGFILPPLMFSEDEIEALVLGSRWVADRGDDLLGSAAQNAIAKIAAVLPAELRESLDAADLLPGPGRRVVAEAVDLAVVRKAIRAERKLWIIPLSRCRWGSDAAPDLAVRARLLRSRARGGRLVRAAAGFPPFPHRPDRGFERHRHSLPAPPSGVAESVAGDRRDSGAGVIETVGELQANGTSPKWPARSQAPRSARVLA